MTEKAAADRAKALEQQAQQQLSDSTLNINAVPGEAAPDSN